MAFLKDVHHGNLEVLKGLRPAAASQTPTGGRIKDSHHGPEPWRGGAHHLWGWICPFLNISKGSEEESQSHTQRQINKKLHFFFLKSIINLIKKQLVCNRQNQNLH